MGGGHRPIIEGWSDQSFAESRIGHVPALPILLKQAGNFAGTA